MTTTYKEGDEVTIRLDKIDAYHLSVDSKSFIFVKQIISHKQAPEPIVGWVNVYSEGMEIWNNKNNAENMKGKNSNRLALLKLSYDPSSKTANVEVVNEC